MSLLLTCDSLNVFLIYNVKTGAFLPVLEYVIGLDTSIFSDKSAERWSVYPTARTGMPRQIWTAPLLSAVTANQSRSPSISSTWEYQWKQHLLEVWQGSSTYHLTTLSSHQFTDRMGKTGKPKWEKLCNEMKSVLPWNERDTKFVNRKTNKKNFVKDLQN